MGSGSTPLDSVVVAREAARSAEGTLRDAVEQARAAGHTWQEIGEILGTSRQAAFQRFGRPVDPRTNVGPAAEPLPGAAERAIALLADMAAGRWEDVRRDFDQAMTDAVSVDGLASVWTQVAAAIGRLERMGEPVVMRFGDHTMVTVVLHCEAGEVNGRVTFNMDGSVAGLLVLPA